MPATLPQPRQVDHHAKIRAAKVAAREPNLVTTFDLRTEIDTTIAEANAAWATGDIPTYTALYNVVRRLLALLPQ